MVSQILIDFFQKSIASSVTVNIRNIEFDIVVLYEISNYVGNIMDELSHSADLFKVISPEVIDDNDIVYAYWDDQPFDEVITPIFDEVMRCCILYRMALIKMAKAQQGASGTGYITCARSGKVLTIEHTDTYNRANLVTTRTFCLW